MRGNLRRGRRVKGPSIILEEEYKTIFETTGNATAIIEEDMTISLVNGEFEKLSGYGKAEIEGKKKWTEFVIKDDLERMKEYHHLRRVNPKAAPRNYEFRFIDRRGIVRNVFLTVSLIPGTRKTVASLSEISELRQAEEALRQSEKRFRVAAESASDLIWEWDIANGHLEWFGNVDEALGYAPGEFPRTLKALEHVIHPEDKGRVMAALDRHLKKRELYCEEYRVQRKDGTFLIWRDRGKALLDAHGFPYKMIGSCTDITSQRQSEQALERRLEFERTIAKISSYFVGASNIDGAINASLRDMGKLNGASRAYVFLFSEDGNKMTNTHEWCNEGVTPQIANLRNLSTDMFPWWMSNLRREYVIQIDDPSKMPAEAKAEKKILLEDQDIKSLLVLPLSVRGELAGFIGFDNVVAASRWSDDDVALLSLSSKIIGDALEHKQMEDAIRNHAEILEKKVHERTQEIERLNATITERLIQKINQISHISEIRETLRKSTGTESNLETILKGVIEDLDMDTAAVFLVDKPHRIVETKAFKSNVNVDISKTYALDRSIFEYECMDENDCTSRVVGEKQSILKAKSIHCAPITIRNEVVGFLVTGSAKEEKLDESDLSVLKVYSGLVSTVFETASLVIEPIKETQESRESRYKIDSGSNFAIEDDIDLAYDIFLDRIMSGMEGLLITRIFPDKVRKRYGLEKTPIIWLNDEKVEGQLTISNLQDLSIAISNYVGKAEKPIILLDGIEYLASNQGFDSVHRFLQSKRNQIESTGSILIVPFFKDALESKQCRLIEREFDIFGQKQVTR